MAVRVRLFSPKIPPPSANYQTHTFPSITLLRIRTKTSIKTKTRISSTNSISDEELASDLAIEMARINNHLSLREEAMKKSRELLFTDFCQYLAMQAEEVNEKWRKMDEGKKCVLINGFISEWGVNFHPLSAKYVKEMVEEHLSAVNQSAQSSPSLFSDLKKIMGFSPNK